MLTGYARRDIRLLRPDAPALKLGDLRNFAIDHAQGQYVCQWDDDDIYDPQRLQLQFEVIQKTRLPACILTRWVVWSPADKRLAISPSRAWEGSLLCLKSVVPRYPALSQGEDTPVIDALVQSKQVALMDAPWMYVYVVHGGNTWNAQHFNAIFEAASESFDGDRYFQMTSLMEERLQLSAYPVYVADVPG